MDVLNAPNPANLNADQFVDVVQGPANQAQGLTVQNQAQGPTVPNPAQGPTNQNQAEVPAGQIWSCSSNSSSRSCSNWSKCTRPATTTTSSSTTGPCRYCSVHSPDNLS